MDHGTIWLVATYKPVSLFSLRTTEATSSGGRTLLCPTPYSVKMALVDAAFRCGNGESAARTFELLKDAEVRFSPPDDVVVQHTFVKVLRESRKAGVHFGSTISYREYCFYRGELSIALLLPNSTPQIEWVTKLLWHVNYFGKRGSFFQAARVELCEELGASYTLEVPNELDRANPNKFGVIQYMDDFGELPKNGFEYVNTYSTKTMRLGQHRILRQFLLPLCQEETSNRYTHYRKTGR